MVETHPQITQARNLVFDFCAEYAKDPAHGRTLVIYGENGAGKSRMAKQISRWAQRIAILQKPVLAKETEKGEVRKPMVEYCSWAEIVDGFKLDEWGKLDDLRGCELLVVDDIGAEHDPSRVGIEKLYVLLNRREFRWNVFSTNVSPAKWTEKFEKRIASRLFRNALHVDLSQVTDFSKL